MMNPDTNFEEATGYLVTIATDAGATVTATAGGLKAIHLNGVNVGFVPSGADLVDIYVSTSTGPGLTIRPFADPTDLINAVSAIIDRNRN
jgi:hypothetical protein